MAPVEASRTVFLFPDAGAMTESAANALLKTLEEPLAQVVFLLVAGSEDDFPPTVASRCRTIHMGRVPQGSLVEALVARGLSADAAEGVAIVSGGRPGLALALMSQPEVARFRDMWLAANDAMRTEIAKLRRRTRVAVMNHVTWTLQAYAWDMAYTTMLNEMLILGWKP